MGKFAAGTTVSVEQSQAEIQKTVLRYGADGFLSGWENNRALVQFRAQGRYIKFILTLPDRNDKAFTTYLRGVHEHQRTPSASAELWEQACRQRWRALLLLVKAKLEAVETGIVTFEEAFLAHVVMDDGLTVYERVRDNVALSYKTGKHMPLIEGPRAT